MIALSVYVDDITTVLIIYDRVEIRRSDDESMTSPVMLTDLGAPNGSEAYIVLTAGTTYYRAYDSTGTSDHWYQSRYFDSTTYSGGNVSYVGIGASGWSTPVKGEAADLFYDPCRAREVDMTNEQQLIVDEIRLLIGNPLDVNREYGEDAASSIHPDGKTYELDEKGWPICVTMGGVQYTDSTDPTINGYRYLIFEDCINTIEVVCSGTCDNTRGIDIWYYTFRHSDRQILEAYDNCPVPPGLTIDNATSQAFILYTAKRLLQQENWHDAIEDGADISDEGTRYSPNPGFDFREKLLDDLNKQLDDLIKSLALRGIEGVRVE